MITRIRSSLTPLLSTFAALAAATTAHAVDLRTVDARALVLGDPKVSGSVKDAVRHPEGASGGLTRSFGDVTGDGRADLVVLVNSGGTAGDTAYYVFAEVKGRIRDIRAVNSAYKVAVSITKRHRLVQRDPIYAANDPNCCPTSIRIRVFDWNGTRLVRISDRTVPTPPG